MAIKLNGATSGAVTITAPAVASNNTITLPSSNGTLVVADNSGGLISNSLQSIAGNNLSLNAGATNGITVDTAGNVGVGTTTPVTKLTVTKPSIASFTGTTFGTAVLIDPNTTANNFTNLDFTTAAVNAPIARIGMQYTFNGSTLSFGTSNNYALGVANTAMTIDPFGNLLVGTTTSTAKLTVMSPSGISPVGYFINSTGSGNQAGIFSNLGSTANNGSSYHFAGSTTGVSTWYLLGNGTTTYTSDERRKKNITTTRDGYLEDICKLRVVKYQWKANADDSPAELGLIAQEVERVFPGLVQNDLTPSDDGITYKTMKGSVFVPMLIKAVQELSAKNDALEARLAVLEAKK